MHSQKLKNTNYRTPKRTQKKNTKKNTNYILKHSYAKNKNK